MRASFLFHEIENLDFLVQPTQQQKKIPALRVIYRASTFVHDYNMDIEKRALLSVKFNMKLKLL